jgi:hypothetical protein
MASLSISGLTNGEVISRGNLQGSEMKGISLYFHLFD